VSAGDKKKTAQTKAIIIRVTSSNGFRELAVHYFKGSPTMIDLDGMLKISAIRGDRQFPVKGRDHGTTNVENQ